MAEEKPEWCRISLYAEVNRSKFDELEFAIADLVCAEKGPEHECEYPWVLGSSFPERELDLIERAEAAVKKARSVYGIVGEYGARMVLKTILGAEDEDDDDDADEHGPSEEDPSFIARIGSDVSKGEA